MSIETWLNYEQYISYMDSQLEIQGQPCTIFSPERKIALGYEDTDYSQIDEMNTDKVLGNKYHKSHAISKYKKFIENSVYGHFA